MNTRTAALITVVVVALGAWALYKLPAHQSVGAGSVKQSAVTIVTETMTGTWQSADDAKYVIEFKADGSATESYDGKPVSSAGTWAVFTKDAPLTTSVPLEDNAAYLQTTSGAQTTPTNFKVATLTETTLSLIYLDRGGALNFTRIR